MLESKRAKKDAPFGWRHGLGSFIDAAGVRGLPSLHRNGPFSFYNCDIRYLSSVGLISLWSTLVFLLLHILVLTHPHLLHNPWPKLKHAEQSRQVFSNRPEHSVLRVLTFHPGWTWGGIVRAPRAPPRPEHNTDTDEPSCAASQRNAESSHKGARENKRASDILAGRRDAERHEKLVEV